MSDFRLSRRRQRQKRSGASLNLVSLMDIFTILVFFLMVNSSEVEMLEPNPGVKLPDSASKMRPDPFVVVSIDHNVVRVGDQGVVTVDELLAEPGQVVAQLRDALVRARVAVGDTAMVAERPVTIMGDRQLPYEVLKKIMASCEAAELIDIELAINQVATAAVGDPG